MYPIFIWKEYFSATFCIYISSIYTRGKRTGKRQLSDLPDRAKDAERINMKKKVWIYNNSSHILEAIIHLFPEEEAQLCMISSEEVLMERITNEGGDALVLDAFRGPKDDADQLEFIRRLREISKLPIIIVSEPVREEIKIRALEAGGDDYVTADRSPLELVARIKAQVARYNALMTSECNERRYCVKELVINDKARKVTVAGREVGLTPIEYKILRMLAGNRGRICSAAEIYSEIWQEPPIGAANTIPVHIRHIREKIEENPKKPQLLKAVWGIGYKIG